MSRLLWALGGESCHSIATSLPHHDTPLTPRAPLRPWQCAAREKQKGVKVSTQDHGKIVQSASGSVAVTGGLKGELVMKHVKRSVLIERDEKRSVLIGRDEKGSALIGRGEKRSALIGVEMFKRTQVPSAGPRRSAPAQAQEAPQGLGVSAVSSNYRASDGRGAVTRQPSPPAAVSRQP